MIGTLRLLPQIVLVDIHIAIVFSLAEIRVLIDVPDIQSYLILTRGIIAIVHVDVTFMLLIEGKFIPGARIIPAVRINVLLAQPLHQFLVFSLE